MRVRAAGRPSMARYHFTGTRHFTRRAANSRREPPEAQTIMVPAMAGPNWATRIASSEMASLAPATMTARAVHETA